VSAPVTTAPVAGKWSLRAAVLLAAGLCIAYGSRGLLAAYVSSRPGVERIDGMSRAAAIVPEHWWYRLKLADVSSVLGRHAEAIADYRIAIANYPSCSRCWIGLAETQAAMREDPTDALEQAVRFGRSETTIRLRAGTLYARLGRHAEAGREFNAVQRGMSDDRHQFYALLHRIYDVNFMLEHVIEPSGLSTYFAFVRIHRPVEETKVAWERYRLESADRGEEQRKAYAQRLLADGFVGDAWKVFFEGAAPSSATVIAGGFETDEDVRPFGWYLNSVDGITATIVECDGCPEGRRALRLEFDGKSNPQFGGMWQDVPVTPGTSYVLHAKVKAAHITSANGPKLAVRGIPHRDRQGACALWAATPDWKLSSPWTDVQLPFRVPEDCDGVRILVARQSTTVPNKFLGGELWMDDVRLERTDQNPAPNS